MTMLCGLFEIWRSCITSSYRSNSNTFGSLSSQNDPLFSSQNQSNESKSITLQSLVLSAIERNDVCSLTDYFSEYTLDDILHLQDLNGETLLMKAARSCKLEVINFLLEMELNIFEEEASSHWNVIHLSCTLPHGLLILTTIADFVTKQDDSNLLFRIVNSKSSYNNITPLHCAIQYCNVEVFRWLIENGAEIIPPNVTSHPTTSMKYMNSKLKSPNSRDLLEIADPYLITAAHYNRRALFEELVDLGADVECRDARENTPLLIACQQGSIEIVVYLVEDLDANIFATGYKKYSALHFAAIHNRVQLCKYLIGIGLNVHARDENGLTPLHHACLLGNHNVTYALVKLGANPYMGDSTEEYDVIDSELIDANLSVPSGRNAFDCALESHANSALVVKAIHKAQLELSNSQKYPYISSPLAYSFSKVSESTSLSNNSRKALNSYGSTIH